FTWERGPDRSRPKGGLRADRETELSSLDRESDRTEPSNGSSRLSTLRQRPPESPYPHSPRPSRELHVQDPPYRSRPRGGHLALPVRAGAVRQQLGELHRRHR